MKKYRAFFFVSVAFLSLLVVACGSVPASSTEEGMKQHSNAGAAPFDAQFLDGMIVHHQGAIDMAKQAQTQAEHQEIKTMANTIIATQQNEITQMQKWRKQWYPNLPPTSGTGMQMGDMKISDDTSKPFDMRFLDSMVSHHQGAVDMAKEAKTKAEHQEIKSLADSIVTSQTKEINDMKQWRSQWYGAATATPTSHGGGGH